MEHPSQRVQNAIVALLDELCSWERSTGRESFLVIIPVEKEESVIVADSGKLIPTNRITYEDVCERVFQALKSHDNPEVHRFIDG